MNKEYDERLKSLGLRIAYYRKLSGMTQAELAKVIGISRTHMSNIEAPRMPTQVAVETLLRIADALEVNPARLFDFNSNGEI